LINKQKFPRTKDGGGAPATPIPFPFKIAVVDGYRVQFHVGFSLLSVLGKGLGVRAPPIRKNNQSPWSIRWMPWVA